MECGQPWVGGNVAKQLTLQVWFGKGAVFSKKESMCQAMILCLKKKKKKE